MIKKANVEIFLKNIFNDENSLVIRRKKLG